MIPQGYKHTELGVIPQEWEILPLSALGEIYSGGTPDTTNPKFWNGEILWCTPSDITSLSSNYISDTEGKITEEGLKKSSAIILPAGSLIVCTRATIGNIAIATKPLSTNQGFKNIVPYNDISVEWLFYNLLSAKNRLVKLGCGSTFLEVSKKDFERFRVAVPPVEEQRKIAEILGVWDKAIELQARLIDKLELRKRALMQRLLSGRHRLPGFSAPWQKVKLSEAGRFLSSNTLSRDKLNHDNGTFQNIHYGDILIHYPAIVNPDIEIIPYINEDTTISSDILKNGDVIFADTAEDNTAGKAIEIINAGTKKITAGLHTIAFRPNNGMFATPFLGYYINSTDYQQQLEPLIQGIKVCSISKSAIKGTYLQVPSLAEQAAIAEVLSTADKEIELAKSKLAAYRTQKRGLMQQLLTGKKRVK